MAPAIDSCLDFRLLRSGKGLTPAQKRTLQREIKSQKAEASLLTMLREQTRAPERFRFAKPELVAPLLIGNVDPRFRFEAKMPLFGPLDEKARENYVPFKKRASLRRVSLKFDDLLVSDMGGAGRGKMSEMRAMRGEGTTAGDGPTPLHPKFLLNFAEN